MASPQKPALVMRKRSYYVSAQQKRQLRFVFAVVLAIPILAIGVLVFIFPDIRDLGDGGRTLLERVWQRMKEEPLEPALFVICCLLGLLQSGYVWLASARERLVVDELGISYVSPLPEFLQVFRPSWKLQWSQIRHARVEISRISPLFLSIVLDAGLTQRKIVPFQWMLPDDEPIGPVDPRKWRSLDPEAITSLLQLSPVTQVLAGATIDLDLDALRSKAKSFALEENPSTLLALVLFFAFISYALVDGAFLLEETYAERPFYEFYVVTGLLFSVMLGIWFLRTQVPRVESLTLAVLVGTGLAVALYPGLLRINAVSDSKGLQQYEYVMGGDQAFTAVDAKLPILRFTRDREYWAQFELGSTYHFELRRGGLDFYQLNLAPVYAAMKVFYRKHQTDAQ